MKMIFNNISRNLICQFFGDWKFLWDSKVIYWKTELPTKRESYLTKVQWKLRNHMKITRPKQNIPNKTCTCLKERFEMAAARCSPSSAVTESIGIKVATANTNPIGNHFKCFISVSRFQSVSWFLGSCPLDLTAYSPSKWGPQCSKVTSRSHSLWMWRIQHSSQTLHG